MDLFTENAVNLAMTKTTYWYEKVQRYFLDESRMFVNHN